MQSDLETLTEMLSDVVARKRLRASRSQIVHATRAARTRRLELEDMVASFALSDAHAVEEYQARVAAAASGQRSRSLPCPTHLDLIRILTLRLS